MPRSDLPRAFFVPRPDGTVLATQATRGPWNVLHQHGGPPAALLARAVERCGPDADAFVVTRLTVDLLRPVPIAAPLRVEIEPVRLGASAQRLVARLCVPGGDVAVQATALRLRRSEVALPDPRHRAIAPLPPPEEGAPMTFPFFGASLGYHDAVEVRIARGTWGAGPCAAWLRPRIALVQDEPLSALEAVVLVADAANGVAMALDVGTHTFINPDITVALARPAVGTWVGIDAHAMVDPRGTGLNDCVMHDQQGALGRIVQSLLVRERVPTSAQPSGC